MSDRTELSERLARIGASVGAQRVELYERDDHHVIRAVGWWAALGHIVVRSELATDMPVTWFPWTLGNLRHVNHVFVANADGLPLRPGSPVTIGEIGMASALYLPLHDGLGPVGAVCCYWAEAQERWDDTTAPHVADLGREALMVRPLRTVPRPE